MLTLRYPMIASRSPSPTRGSSLEGQHQYESNAAFEAVSGIPGVGGITNEIRVITAGVDG